MGLKQITFRSLVGLGRKEGDPYHDQYVLLSDRKVGTVIDGGARIGEVTARYSAVFPEATIYCFEPSPEAFGRLKERFKGTDRIYPIQMALSDSICRSTLFLNQNSATNSMFPPVK